MDIQDRPINDAILVRLSQQGDTDALSKLYSRHVSTIYNYVLRRVGNREDAEDITSQVFLNALKKLHEYEDRGVPFRAWIFRIAHNLTANHHRYNTNHPKAPLADILQRTRAKYGDPLNRALAKEECRQLLNKLRGLNQTYQAIIYLKFAAGLTNAQIGTILDMSESAVRSRYFRALRKLRSSYQAKKR